MINLSVNVNKVATVRNSRGGTVPSVVEAAQVCIDAGVQGITVHPRADARHITFDDVRELARLLAPYERRVEFNIEGDPRPDLLALVREVRPDQCTLVPVASRRDHQSGGLAARHARRRDASRRRGPASARRSREPVRRPGTARRGLGGRDRRRPRGAVHRALCACVRCGRAPRAARASRCMSRPLDTLMHGSWA